jgi:STE24 endopeptidase
MKKPLPKNVALIYQSDQYKQSQLYKNENMFFSLVKSTFSTLLILGLFFSGVFPLLFQFITTLTSNEILQTFVFLATFILFNSLINIPFNYYRTFSIETRYGFNKTSKKLFISDSIRSTVLSVVIVSSLASLLHTLFLSVGDLFIPLTWLTLTILLILLFTLNTKVFIKIFNKLTPLPDGSLKSSIEQLATKTGFKAKAIYSMDASKRSSKLNAFFSGFGPIREIGLFDTLIAKLKEEEILAVLAHEIGHAKHFDELRLLFQQILIFGIYAFLIQVSVTNIDLANAFGFSTPFFAFSLILFTILVEPISLIISIPVNYLSRKAEYAADAYAVQQGYKDSMLSALKVLVTENFANLNPHPFNVLISYSHPPMHQRLAAIEKL